MNREEAINLRQHPSWKPLCEEVDKMIERARVKLENADPKTVDVIILQERIKALKALKALPDNVAEREESASTGAPDSV